MPATLMRSLRDTGMVWLSMFVLGSGLGIMVAGSGLPWWVAPLLSGTIYAGSVEFLLVGLLTAAAPLSAIALTTALVNSRHLFYGLAFPLQRVHGLARLYSIFALTDEAFALTVARSNKELSNGWILCTQAGLQLSWISGSLTGVIIGATLLQDIQGLDFILTALFIALAMDAYRARPDRLALAAALVCGSLAAMLAGDAMLVVAMSAFTLLMLLRYRLHRTKHA